MLLLIVSKFAFPFQSARRARVSPRSEPGGKRPGMVRYQAIMSSTVATSGRGSPLLSTTAFMACICSPMLLRPARPSAMTSPCARAADAPGSTTTAPSAAASNETRILLSRTG
jgi:hypothetical protein